MKYRGPWELFVWSKVREGFIRIWIGIQGAWFIIGGGLVPGSSLQPAWKRWLRIRRWEHK